MAVIPLLSTWPLTGAVSSGHRTESSVTENISETRQNVENVGGSLVLAIRDPESHSVKYHPYQYYTLVLCRVETVSKFHLPE